MQNSWFIGILLMSIVFNFCAFMIVYLSVWWGNRHSTVPSFSMKIILSLPMGLIAGCVDIGFIVMAISH